MAEIHEQLNFAGLDSLVRVAEAGPNPRAEVKRIMAAHQALAELADEDIAFCHSGLCQTALPHSRPGSDDALWKRSSGRFHLIVAPGVFVEKNGEARRVGVPYGSRARLIMLYLQSEGVKSRTVSLGNSMSAWIRSLGLQVSGGPRGNIGAIKEQSLRIARSEFTLQWSEARHDGDQVIIRDQRIVDGLSLWENFDRTKWSAEVFLTNKFHDHLREHAVPLSNHAIAYLAGNSFGLDLYTTLAYRLPRLDKSLMLSWIKLSEQFGSDIGSSRHFAQRIRAVMPKVLDVYPDAKVDVTRKGLLLQPSKPAVPYARVGFAGTRLHLIGSKTGRSR